MGLATPVLTGFTLLAPLLPLSFQLSSRSSNQRLRFPDLFFWKGRESVSSLAETRPSNHIARMIVDLISFKVPPCFLRTSEGSLIHTSEMNTHVIVLSSSFFHPTIILRRDYNKRKKSWKSKTENNIKKKNVSNKNGLTWKLF